MKKLLFLSLMVLMTGCSLDATLQKLQKLNSSIDILSSVRTTGLISGSQQVGAGRDMNTNQINYFVQGSVGGMMSSMAQQSSDGSYTVYSSVQGTIAPRQK